MQRHTRLVFSAPGDGVVVYHPKGPSIPKDKVFREMREAPDSGYVAAIDFDALQAEGGYHYFFCRIGGHFGKGYVYGPFFEGREQYDSMSATIEIRVNPDGSQNVTTWH